MFGTTQDILVKELANNKVQITFYHSDTFLELIHRSPSSESINQDPTASQGGNSPKNLSINYTNNTELVNQLLRQVRVYRRENYLYQPPKYSHDNVIIHIWNNGFINIKIADQEINVWEYEALPTMSLHQFCLSGLSVNKMLEKLKTINPNTNWDTFGKNNFRAKNVNGNSAKLVCEILTAGNLNEILELSSCKVNTHTINSKTLVNILNVVNQTQIEDMSINMQQKITIPDNCTLDDQLFDIILISAFAGELINIPKITQENWQLDIQDEDLKIIIETYSKTVTSTQMKDWFQNRYNYSNSENDDQKNRKFLRRKTLIDLSENLKQLSKTVVKEPLLTSRNTTLNEAKKDHKTKQCCVM